MLLNVPSRTALRVAMRRAAHQVHDKHPLVFDDPFALRILPAEAQTEVRANANTDHPASRGLRAWMVVRSRFAEDHLAQARKAGTQQYVVLGAGLDTFSWRACQADALTIFEVDHPTTQNWKRALTIESGMGEPASTRYVPVNFERDSLAECLQSAGFKSQEPACFSWLGVVPYLTIEGFRQTLRFLARCATGSEIVFDYAIPPDVLSETERAFFDSMAKRVAQTGEPFQLFFQPEEVAAELQAVGWHVDEDLNGSDLHSLYLKGRSDGLALQGRVGRLLSARKPSIVS